MYHAATQVASRLGVPAGPLLDSNWTSFAARMGFDIVTYKTIRTQASTGTAHKQQQQQQQ
jgi:hypothetical protein